MTQPLAPKLPSVLVVENSPAIRRLLQVVLRNVADQVFLTANPDDARAVLSAEAIDVAVIEPQGPATLSWDLVDELVSLAIPTVVVTSRTTEDVLDEAARRNASAIVTKPFAPATLVEAIAGLPDHRSEISLDISDTKTNSAPESQFE